MRDIQLAHEELTDSQAAADRLEHLKTQALSGDTELPRTQRFIARAYASVVAELDATKALQTRGNGGKFKTWLRAIPSDVAAVIALRECIGTITSRIRAKGPVTVQDLATRVGRLYETEVCIREAEAVNPMYMKRIHEQVKENCTTSQAHLRKLYNVAYQRVMKGEMDNRLDPSELMNIGKFGVDAVLKAGIIEGVMVAAAKGRVLSFNIAPEVQEYLTEYGDEDVHGVINKATGVMMCEPDPWTTLKDGGYLSPRRKFSQPLMAMGGVRKSERKRLREEVFTAEAMPEVFECANYMQSRRFAVHIPTMEAITRLYREGGGTMGVPRRLPPVRPDCPLPAEWVKDEGTEAEQVIFTAWKHSVVQWHTAMRNWRGKTREVTGFIKVAASAPDSMYFPVFMDKRGRWYYRGSPNPQGSDLSKSAIHYGNKKALGARGLFWLRVHIANCFGFDKVRFADRAAWTIEHWESIRNALPDPENHPDVWGTDAPWCMYSAAYELNAALSSPNPEAYETGIVIHMDATCSGLQHFSAILRDPVGGSYVNLMDDHDGGPKQDIYARVSVNAMLQIDIDTQSEDAELARMAMWWKTFGISRSMAKTPVMTYVYGATLRGTTEFVQGYVTEQGGEFPADVRPYDYAAYAAKKLFEGIARTVPSAEAAMNWLRAVAQGMPKGTRMEWKSPTGFAVQHDYMAYEEKRVELRSCGVRTALIRIPTADTLPRAMQNAIAPNFVHALDAAHFTKCVLAMKKLGLDILGIHDSYGTHPCDVDALHTCIRTSFVDLYLHRNVLAEFLWEVGGIGEVPMRGTLDLRQVLDSEFFFC